MGAVARMFGVGATVDDARAEFAKAVKAREAAEVTYDSDPTASNETNVTAAQMREGRCRRLLVAAEERAAEAEQQRAAEARRAEEAHLVDLVATANGWADRQAPRMAQVIELEKQLYAHLVAMRADVEAQNEAHRSAEQLAANLGLEVKLQSRAHMGSVIGLVGRAMHRALSEQGRPRSDFELVQTAISPQAH